MLKIHSCSKLAPHPATVCSVPELSKRLARAAALRPDPPFPFCLGWFGNCTVVRQLRVARELCCPCAAGKGFPGK